MLSRALFLDEFIYLHGNLLGNHALPHFSGEKPEAWTGTQKGNDRGRIQSQASYYSRVEFCALLLPPSTHRRSLSSGLYRFVLAEGWWDRERRTQRLGFTHIWALLDTPRAGHDLPLRDPVSGFLVHPAWLIKVCPPLPHPHPQTLEHVSSPQDHLRHILTPRTFCPLPSLRALNCKTGTIQTYFPSISPPTHTFTLDPFSEARGALSTGRQCQHFLEQPRATTSVIRLGPNPPTILAALACGMVSCHGLSCPSLDFSA